MPDTSTGQEVTSLEFAHWVRTIAAHMRAMELRVPAFRSPPRVPGVTRTMRPGRNPGDPPTIAIALKGRTRRDVLLDMLAGAVAAARLLPHGSTAGQLRSRVIRELGVDTTPPDDDEPGPT